MSKANLRDIFRLYIPIMTNVKKLSRAYCDGIALKVKVNDADIFDQFSE